jgi:uncharacterized protein
MLSHLLMAPELFADEALSELDHGDEVAEFYTVVEAAELRRVAESPPASWTRTVQGHTDDNDDEMAAVREAIQQALPDLDRADEGVRDAVGQLFHFITLG